MRSILAVLFFLVLLLFLDVGLHGVLLFFFFVGLLFFGPQVGIDRMAPWLSVGLRGLPRKLSSRSCHRADSVLGIE